MIKKVEGGYMIEGSSQRFKTLEEASKFVKNTQRKRKNNSNKGRGYISERLQMAFRSTWEIELAEMMTDLGIAFEYEPKRFYFREHHESYLPDFYLPEYNCWIEVKGWMDRRSLKRCTLFKKYEGANTAFFLWEKEERLLTMRDPELLRTYIQIAQEEHERRVQSDTL